MRVLSFKVRIRIQLGNFGVKLVVCVVGIMNPLSAVVRHINIVYDHYCFRSYLISVIKAYPYCL